MFFIVEAVNLVMTKVIKHRVNGWDPCEQHCEALLPFRQTPLWSRGTTRGRWPFRKQIAYAQGRQRST